MMKQFERVERLHVALETLKRRQAQHASAKAALEKAEIDFRLAEVLLATAQQEVESATDANKSDGLD